jgi:hypothetical protein
MLQRTGGDEMNLLETPAVAPSMAPPWAVTARDRRILELAAGKLRGARLDFAEALRALREAVEESIPDGRVFWLGRAAEGPIVGSIISGVGIVDGPGGIQIVRAFGAGSGRAPVRIGRFSP